MDALRSQCNSVESVADPANVGKRPREITRGALHGSILGSSLHGRP